MEPTSMFNMKLAAAVNGVFIQRRYVSVYGFHLKYQRLTDGVILGFFHLHSLRIRQVHLLRRQTILLTSRKPL